MLTRPGLLLRLEGLAALVAALICYFALLHGKWIWLVVFFLVPDVSLLGYLSGKQKGLAAGFYNAVHSYVLPLILGFAAWKMGTLHGEQAAAIWIAHIAFDRLLGFGLKYPEAFRPTHLQMASIFRP
jgi:hypothetical protein